MVNRSTQGFIAFVIELVVMFVSTGKRKWVIGLVLVLIMGMFIPQKIAIPVKGATPSSWAHDSFWHYPWGKSVTHKGIDIFADHGTNVLSATHGLVVYSGYNGMGGNALIVLGPKWRFHYYAHLESKSVGFLRPVKSGSVIGTVGDTGNAKGKPPHLHYTISSPIPYVHLADSTIQGWKKMFYLNPDVYLRTPQ